MLDLNIYPDMAAIYIDNLVRPRQTNSPNNFPAKETSLDEYIYADLHLDLKAQRKIGVGVDPANSNDILSDTDTDAIRNALYNLFTTRPGQKLLTPSFGANLEQFLFEKITPVNARVIGNTINSNIKTFEPRIQVLKIQVTPQPDQNQYRVVFVYKLLNKGGSQSFSIQIQSNNNITIT
jgi:phage baseplate assembly protein W